MTISLTFPKYRVQLLVFLFQKSFIACFMIFRISLVLLLLVLHLRNFWYMYVGSSLSVIDICSFPSNLSFLFECKDFSPFHIELFKSSTVLASLFFLVFCLLLKWVLSLSEFLYLFSPHVLYFSNHTYLKFKFRFMCTFPSMYHFHFFLLVLRNYEFASVL